MEYNKPTQTAYSIFEKQTRLTSFLFNLLELLNVVSLLEVRKREYKANPTPKNKQWYNETQKALKRLKDETNLYADEYLYLNNILKASMDSRQILTLDNRTQENRHITNLRFQFLREKSEALKIINKFLEPKNAHTDTQNKKGANVRVGAQSVSTVINTIKRNAKNKKAEHDNLQVLKPSP